MLLGLTPPDKKSSAPEEGYSSCAVLSGEQIGLADRLTIEALAHKDAGFDLMLSAGQALANITHKYYPDYHVLILCGAGNNGGDGFVAGRFLKDIGHEVSILAAQQKWSLPKISKTDAQKARKFWGGEIQDLSFRPDIPEKTVVIDAIFGTGFKGALPENIFRLFEDVRSGAFPVVAADIPSGICCDTGSVAKGTLKARHSVTFFRKKCAHLLMPSMPLCGDVSVHDIGIDDAVLDKTGITAYENKPALWLSQFPVKKQEGHKFKSGHVLMLGGDEMTGAIRLASEASMRAGAGLCTVAATKKISSYL